MSTEQYNQGYQAFSDGMSEDQVKHQHPMFRAGWRDAQHNVKARNISTDSLKCVKVDKNEKVPYTLKWNDLNSALHYKPWAVLQTKDELQVLGTAMRNIIWKKKDEITSFSQVMHMIKTMWFGILETGYNEGILNEYDLKQYDYIPKNLRDLKEVK